MEEEILIKYLLGESSAKEQQKVKLWLKESPLHQKELNKISLIWEQSKKLEPKHLPDTELAWQKFNERRLHDASIPVKPLFRSRSFIYKLAAAIVLLISAAGLIFLRKENPTYILTQQKVSKNTLPDGSKIVLNCNTSLSYQDFDGKERVIRLQHGEAFFDVKPDKTRPFIIEAKGIEIKVLGTSFNVKQRDTITEIIVERGLVSVTRGKDIIKLKAGEKVFIGANSRSLQKQQNTDQLFRFYSNQLLIADNTPLWRIVEVLNETYQTKIDIKNPQLKNAKLNATFKDEPLDEILKVIAVTFNAKITKIDEQQIIISLKE